MAQENAEILEAAVEAFSRGDFAAAQARFHPHAEFRNTTGGFEGVTFRGERLVEDWFASLSEIWEDYRAEFGEVRGEGDALVAAIRNLGRARGSGFPLDDRRWVAVIFKDGLIWRVQTCPTEEEALSVAGLSG